MSGPGWIPRIGGGGPMQVRPAQRGYVAAPASLLALAAWQSGHGARQARPTRNGTRHRFAKRPPRSSTRHRFAAAAGSDFRSYIALGSGGTSRHPCRSPPFGGGERVRLAGQRGQGGGHFGEAGADVGRGGAGLAAAVGVPSIGAGDSVAEIPFDPG
jgi:hypothetical protein